MMMLRMNWKTWNSISRFRQTKTLGGVMFKITAAEKKEILRRRKAKGWGDYDLKDIKQILENAIEVLENDEDLDELSFIEEAFEDGDLKLPPGLSKGITIARATLDKLIDILDGLANGKEKRWENFRGNKIVVKF